MRRPVVTSRLLRAALLAGAALLAALPSAARAQSDAELPGWYRWYRQAGADPRLPDEVRRDASPDDATWAPRAVARALPDLRLPNGQGERVDPLARDGRWTVIVATQAWW